MRVASRIPFGDRRTGESKVRKKYFFAFEGKKTEVIYFTGLFRKYQRLSKSPVLFEVIVFARTKIHDGESHPIKVLQLLNDSLQNKYLSASECTYRELVESYISYRQNELDSRAKRLIFCFAQQILSANHLKENDVIGQPESKIILEKLEEYCELHLTITGGAANVKAVFFEIQRDDLAYDKEIDDVCLIVDRDKKSFFSDQFDVVCKGCSEEGYRLFVTNPCFEFFLLLHKTDGKEYSQHDLVENEKEKEKTFVLRMLESYVKGYKKEKYSFVSFQDDVQIALHNSKAYASKLSDIKTLPGSNLPELIEELLKRMPE